MANVRNARLAQHPDGDPLISYPLALADDGSPAARDENRWMDGWMEPCSWLDYTTYIAERGREQSSHLPYSSNSLRSPSSRSHTPHPHAGDSPLTLVARSENNERAGERRAGSGSGERGAGSGERGAGSAE